MIRHQNFRLITDDALLDLVQRQTFRYFYDFAHPASGLARERNSSGDVVTTGGIRLRCHGHDCCNGEGLYYQG
ncbi:MAG: hypothetical protein MZV63_69035 [Marinilabiliales bacterium]|nr:hypothetical protein [Marinilabiliales bacterium]